MSQQALIRDVINALPRHSGRSMTIGICGYPFTGKTAFSHALITAWPKGGVHLPTESVIADRCERRSADQNGCSAEAHDLLYLTEIMQRLRTGSPVRIPQYSWSLGRTSPPRESAQLSEGELLVVDGSVVAEDPVRAFCDLVLIFRPRVLDDGLFLAVERDVRERTWTYRDAVRENIAKFDTVTLQLNAVGQGGPQASMIYVEVDFDDEECWTFTPLCLPAVETRHPE